MPQPPPPTPHDSAVGTFLDHIQGMINRLASQSSASKNWTATLVAGVSIFTLEKEPKFSIWPASILVVLLGFMDAYYLSLERDFVSTYRSFVAKLHAGTAAWNDVLLSPVKNAKRLGLVLAAFFSLSVWPFYVTLAIAPVWVHSVLQGKAAAELRKKPDDASQKNLAPASPAPQPAASAP